MPQEPVITKQQIVLGAIIAALFSILGFSYSLSSLDALPQEVKKFAVLDRREAESGKISVHPFSQYRRLKHYAPRTQKTYVAFQDALGRRGIRRQYDNSKGGSAPSDSYFLGMFPVGGLAENKDHSPNQGSSRSGKSAKQKKQDLLYGDKGVSPSRLSPAGSASKAQTSGGNTEGESILSLPTEVSQDDNSFAYPLLAVRHSVQDLDSIWDNCSLGFSPVVDDKGRMLGAATFASTGSLIYSQAGKINSRHSPHLRLQSYGNQSNNALGLNVTSIANSNSSTLSPVGVTNGAKLVSNSNLTNEKEYATNVVTGNVGNGLFFFRGPAEKCSRGGPLFNEYSELSGIILGRLDGYPGHDYSLAADSSLINALVHTGQIIEGEQYDPQVVIYNKLLAAVKSVARNRPSIQHPLRRNSRIVPGRSLGNFYLGASLGELRALLGEGKAITSGTHCQEVIYEHYHLSFTFLDGILVCISTDEPSYATATGVGVGTRWIEARRSVHLEEVGFGSSTSGLQVVVGAGIELELDDTGRAVVLRVTPS